MKVRCEICQETIAITTIDRLSLPLRGSMFDSADPAHGLPAPWDASLGWDFMWCPWGRNTHRPFALPNRILTDQGYVTVGTGDDESEITPKLADDDLQSIIDRAQNQIGARVRADFAGEEKPEPEPDISDEDAEAIVRANLAKGQPVMVDGKPNVPAGVTLHTCDVPGCGKPFSNKQRLSAHLLSHRKHREGRDGRGA